MHVSPLDWLSATLAAENHGTWTLNAYNLELPTRFTFRPRDIEDRGSMIRPVIFACMLLALSMFVDTAWGESRERPLLISGEDQQILRLAEQVLSIDSKMVADFAVGPIEIPEFDVVTGLDPQELPPAGELALRSGITPWPGSITSMPSKRQSADQGASGYGGGSSRGLQPQFSDLDLVVPPVKSESSVVSTPPVASALAIKSAPAATVVALQFEGENWDKQPSPPVIPALQDSPAATAERETAEPDGTSSEPAAIAGDIATQDRTQSPESLGVARHRATNRLSPSMMALGDRVQRCLRFYYNRPLNTQDDSSLVDHAFVLRLWGRDTLGRGRSHRAPHQRDWLAVLEQSVRRPAALLS